MAANQPFVSASYADASNEVSNVSFYVDAVDFDADSAAITAAIDAVSAGIRRKTDIVLPYVFSNATPTGVHANRESKMIVSYEDTVTFKRYVASIPMPNLAVCNRLPNTDLFDLTDEPVASLVTALEANALSQDGNAINILSCKFVGRNI